MHIQLTHITSALAIAAALLLGACKNDSFSIEAKIEGLGDREVTIVYANSYGVQSQSVTSHNDVIKYEGYAPQTTVVNLVMPDGMPTIRTAAINGDNIKLKGMLGSPYPSAIKGGDTAHEWLKFISEHLTQVESNASTGELNPEIAEYVKANPKSVVSTLLLIYNYDPLFNNETADSLLNIISDEAKPVYMISTYNALRNELNKANRSRGYYQFTLPSLNGKWEAFSRPDKGYALIWAWSDDDRNHRQCVDSIKRLESLYGKRLAVSTILIDADTMRWRSRIKSDSITQWSHYWAPGGPNSPSIKSFGLMRTPTVLLIDSFGANPYRGNSIAAAEKLIKDNDAKRSKIQLIR